MRERPRRRLFSWVSAPQSSSLANFVVGTLVLAVLFGAGFALTHDQPNSGLFLAVSLIFLGVGVMFALVAGLEQVGTAVLRRSGRTGREAAIGGLLAISLLVPWSVAIRAARAGEVVGWKDPVAWVAVLAIGAPLVARVRRWTVPGLVVGAASLAAWLLWVAFQLLRPDFRGLSFPFLPIDLLGLGWYAALVAWVLAVDGVAVAAADDPVRSPAELWPLAVVPGLALARLGFVARGRFWLIGAALLVVLIQGDAYAPQEFAVYGAQGGLPDVRTRLPALAATAGLLIISGLSVWDTRRMLDRLRRQGAKLRILRGGQGEE